MEGILVIAAVVAGVAAHIVLVLLRGWLHPLFLIAGVFLILSPMSMAISFEGVGMIKYARLYATVLMVVLGLAAYGLVPHRRASLALLAFVFFYVVACLWSRQPFWGLFYKGMFALTLLSGVVLAHAPRSGAEMLRGLRWLGLVAGFAGLAVFAQFAANPSASMQVGRLALWGLNANTVGMTAAALFILAFYLALHEQSPRWRLFARVVVGLLGVEILATGSRGSLMMAGVGALVSMLPLTRRPGRLIAVMLVMGSLAAVMMSVVQVHSLDRFQKINIDTREGVWQRAWKAYLESPVYGRGWMDTDRGTTGNVMSIYLQTLVETGLVGASFLLVCLAMIAASARQLLVAVRRADPRLANVAYLALGLVAAVLAHGLIESGTLMGSTLNSLILGFGVGLIDRLPELMTSARRTVAAAPPPGRRDGLSPTGWGVPPPVNTWGNCPPTDDTRSPFAEAGPIRR